MQTLREILGKPVLFHRVGWHGKSTPNLAGYDSRSPKRLTSHIVPAHGLRVSWARRLMATNEHE
jgi:hypothetical protein